MTCRVRIRLSKLKPKPSGSSQSGDAQRLEPKSPGKAPPPLTLEHVARVE
jgi:hypothetical protein